MSAGLRFDSIVLVRFPDLPSRLFALTVFPLNTYWRADAVMCGLLSSVSSSAIACLEAFSGLAILQACASPSDITVPLCTRVSAFRTLLSLLSGFPLSVPSTGEHRCRENSLVAWIRSNSRVSACERPCGGFDSGNRRAQTLHSYSPAVFLGISAAKPCRESFLNFMGMLHLLVPTFAHAISLPSLPVVYLSAPVAYGSRCVRIPDFPFSAIRPVRPYSSGCLLAACSRCIAAPPTLAVRR